MYAQVLPVDPNGRVQVNLEFKAFFVSLVERTYSNGQSLAQIREDIATLRRELTVEDTNLDELPLEQWAEEAIFALKRRANGEGEGKLAICNLCGKINPYQEKNCATFCPYGA
jgi:hypothetical protein